MHRFILFLLSLASLSISCQTTTSTPTSAALPLLEQFPSISLPDTLHVWREMPWQQFTSISDSLLTSVVDDSLLQILSPYIDDAEELQAMGRFQLGQKYEACMIQIKYSWYIHIAWILFEQEKKSFTGARLLSGLDGGDGGQYLTESWLLDWESDGDLDQLLLSHSHTMIPGEEDFQVVDEDEIELFLWEKEQFWQEPLQDHTALLERFAIDW